MNSRFTLKISVILFACWFSANAQITHTKASGATASGSFGFTNLSNAADVTADYLTTSATIKSVAGLGTNDRYIQLSFTNDVPANTPAYVKIGAETPLLQVLLGGALGNLLGDLVGGLVDGSQTVTIQTYTNTGTSAVLSSSSFNTETMKVVVNSNGDYLVRIVSPTAFRKIRVINHANAGLFDADKELYVFGAYHEAGTSTCTAANYTSYSGNALINLVDIGVFDPQKAVDGNNSTYSQLDLGVVSVAGNIEQTIYFQGTSSASDKYNVKLALDASVLQVTVLSSVTITGYSGTSTTAAYTANLNTLVGLAAPEVLGLLQNHQPATITLSPGVAIDRITIKLTGFLNVDLDQQLHLYGVTKGNFDLSVTGAGSYQVNAPVTLNAVTSNALCGTGFTYSWTGPNATTGTGSSLPVNTGTPGTYTYYVTVTDSNGTQKSTYATVIVEQPPVGGSLNSITADCADSASGTLTLTGYTGTILKWQSSADAAFTTPIDIANTTATLAVSGITQTTYYRAVVGLNSYTPVHNTTGGVVTPKTTTWNGTAWSNGTPDSNTIIHFTGNYSTAANLNGCKAIVENNAVVTIPAGFTLHLNKSIKVLSGSFTLQNEAHLMQDTATEANEGNITVTRNSSNLFKLDYTLWSAPVTGQNLKAFSPATLNDRFYRYAYVPASNQELYVALSPLTNSFDTATGYLIRMPDANATAGYNTGATAIVFEGLFTGVPHNGTINKTLSTVGGRFTAVGNPYPSPINVHDFFNTNASVLKSGSALYFWRKKNNNNASSYATLTYDLYTYNHAIGGNPGEGNYGGNQWDEYFNAGNAANWVINPGQGFLVRTKSEFATGDTPQLTFNAAMRRANVHDNQFFKTANNEEDPLKSRIWINMGGSNDSFSQAALVYSSTATPGLDYGRDAEAITSGSPIALWSNYDNLKLVVQARPQFDAADVVSIGYRTDVAGQYTLMLHRADGVFSQGQQIFIKDNLLGTTINISEGNYTFTTDAGTFNTRFEVLYAAQGSLGTDTAQLEAGSIIVYKQNNSINISSAAAQITGVKVYDVRGRILYSAADINANQASVDNLAAAQQILIIEVTTVKGSISKKIAY